MGEQHWPRIMWPAVAPALFLEQHSTTSAGTQQMLRYLPWGRDAMFTTPGPRWWIIILPRSEEWASQQNQVFPAYICLVHQLCLLISLRCTVKKKWTLHASVKIKYRNLSVTSTMKYCSLNHCFHKWRGIGLENMGQFNPTATFTHNLKIIQTKLK